MKRFASVLAVGWLTSVCAQATPDSSATFAIDAPVRLSQWLKEHPTQAQDYPLGLMWETPEQRKKQAQALARLRADVQARHQAGKLDAAQQAALNKILDAMALTGRVRVPAADGPWLEASPRRDPMLRPGDTLRLPDRDTHVRVLDARAQVCELPHAVGAAAAQYVQACQSAVPAWVWVVQPDGRIERHPTQLWNAQSHSHIAPGAWLWAPPDGLLTDTLNQALLAQLSAQGFDGLSALPVQKQPAPQRTEPHWTSMLDLPGERLVSQPSSSDWGGVGLLQMPTARMRELGFFGVSPQVVRPYQRLNVVAQPAQDLEFAFRYTNITNVLYGPTSLSGNQAYVDKSIDAKLRVWHESTWLPEIAVGLHDMTGTGLFSGEYVVASKQLGRLDFSGGLNWGYLAQRGTMSNPLSAVFGKNANVRTIDVGQGGQLGTSAWFHGRAAPFVGVAYETPWNTTVKLEYDSNNYRNEPFGNVFKTNAPINAGLVYHASKWVDWHVSLERGNTVGFGVTLYTDLAGPSFPKLSDPALPAATRHPASSSERQEPVAWAQTAQDIQQHARWEVQQMALQGDTLTVQAQGSLSVDPQGRLDKAVSVLNRDAPAEVNYFEIHHNAANSDLVAQRVDRDAWLTAQTEPARVNDPEHFTPPNYLVQQPTAEAPTPPAQKLLPESSYQLKLEPGLDLMQTLGGPDAFDLYQFSAYEHLNIRFGNGWQVNGVERLRVASNYELFKYDAPSSLPRVRTYLREYLTTNRVTMSNLTLSNTQRLSDNLYGAAYVGYFEEMFGGVGGELMYREGGSHWAWGLDANRVRQRGFGQDFSWLNPNYVVDTGHFTTYWQTPFEGVTASLALGQYLAKDRGATLALTKTFKNGSVIGAYATKTNVPAQTFGEGSFDKGIYWSIPIDMLSTRTSNGSINWTWKPLTRDGGAMVGRPVNLYNTTGWLNPDAPYYHPGMSRDDDVIPDDRLQ